MINRIYTKAKDDIDSFNKENRKTIRSSLKNYDSIIDVVLDESIKPKNLRDKLLGEVNRETLCNEKVIINRWLNGKIVIFPSFLNSLILSLLKFQDQF